MEYTCEQDGGDAGIRSGHKIYRMVIGVSGGRFCCWHFCGVTWRYFILEGMMKEIDAGTGVI